MWNGSEFSSEYTFCKYCCFSGCTSCPLVFEVTHTIHPPTQTDTDGWPQGRRRSDTAPFPMETHTQIVSRAPNSQPAEAWTGELELVLGSAESCRPLPSTSTEKSKTYTAPFHDCTLLGALFQLHYSNLPKGGTVTLRFSQGSRVTSGRRGEVVTIKYKPECIHLAHLIPLIPIRYFYPEEAGKQSDFIGAKQIRVIICIFPWMAG